MNTIEFAKDEMLDHALIQCLRLFAKRGRMIRSQDLPSEEQTVDNEMLNLSSKATKKEADNQQ